MQALRTGCQVWKPRACGSDPPIGSVGVRCAFRAAVETGDLEAATGLLADDVVFRSPAVFKPYEGAAAVSRLLRTAYAVFEDFRYTNELAGSGVHALIFEARVGDRTLQGMDLLRVREDGRITELTVMVRPASGLAALAQEMGARLTA